MRQACVMLDTSRVMASVPYCDISTFIQNSVAAYIP